MEQPKTECPFCGNVWQQHTLNELNGCKAIMKLQFNQALARSARLQGEAGVSPWPAEICPVCSKAPEEHSEEDLRSCTDKWRKRERGATGLELQGAFWGARLKNEEPDPVKRAELQAQFLQRLCSKCGKALGDHTEDEIRACFDRKR